MCPTPTPGQATSGVKHPKMPALAEVLLQHFQEFEAALVAAEAEGGGANGARRSFIVVLIRPHVAI
jgi:hypothetical protein